MANDVCSNCFYAKIFTLYETSDDHVKVVRCKDCKHWMYEYDNVGLCVTDVPDVDGVQRLDIDFCSYGERKDSDAMRRKCDGFQD